MLLFLPKLQDPLTTPARGRCIDHSLPGTPKGGSARKRGTPKPLAASFQGSLLAAAAAERAERAGNNVKVRQALAAADTAVPCQRLLVVSWLHTQGDFR